MALPMGKSFLSVAEAASLAGCTHGRIRQLLLDGSLSGLKLNARAWAVDRRSVEKFCKNPRTTGRPRTGDHRETNA